MDHLIQETLHSLQSLQQQVRLQPQVYQPKPPDMATLYQEQDKHWRKFCEESSYSRAAESTQYSPGVSSQPWDMSSQGDTSLDLSRTFDEAYSDVGSQVVPTQSLLAMRTTGMESSFNLDAHPEMVPKSKGIPPYQKFGPVKPLPAEEPWLEAASPGYPNPYTRKMLQCEIGQERDLPKPVDHMDGWPIAPRLYPTSPRRPSPRPSPRSSYRRERSIEDHVQRQRSASIRRQESRERSPVRDPWLESTFFRNPGSASFSRGAIRSIAGYDSPKRAKQLTAEVAPTLTERSRFSWTQDIDRNLERMRRLRAKVKCGATSPAASPAPSPQLPSRSPPPGSAEAFSTSPRRGRLASSSSPCKANRKIAGHDYYEDPLGKALNRRSSCDSSVHSTFLPSSITSTPAMTARDPLLSSWGNLSMMSPPMSPHVPTQDVDLGGKASSGISERPTPISSDEILCQASEPVNLRANKQGAAPATSGQAFQMTSADHGEFTEHMRRSQQLASTMNSQGHSPGVLLSSGSVKAPPGFKSDRLQSAPRPSSVQAPPGGKTVASARHSLGSLPSQNVKMDMSSAYPDYVQTLAHEAPQLQVPTENNRAALLPSWARRVSAPMIVNTPRHTLMSPQVDRRFSSAANQPQPVMSPQIAQQTPLVATQQLPHGYPDPWGQAAGARSSKYRF